MSEEFRDVRLSSIDVAKLVNEYREKLIGAYIANVYQADDLFCLKLRGVPNKRFLILHPQYRFNLSNKIFEWETTPIVGIFRRYLRNRKIISLKQYFFDRIINIELSDNIELICEIIPRGVLALVKDNIIVAASRYQKMKDREIRVKARYEYPPNPPQNPLEIPIDDFVQILTRSRSIYRGLMRLGIGPKYAFEICARLEINCTELINNPDFAIEIRKEVEKLFMEILNSNKGFVYLKNETPIFFSPILLSFAKNYEIKEFESFDEAIDYYFSYNIIRREEERSFQPVLERKKKLLGIIENQRKAISQLETKISKLRKVVELIYNYYSLIEEVLETIQKAKDIDGLDWEEIRRRIEYGKKHGIQAAIIIENIQNDGTIIFKMDNIFFSANYRENVNTLTGRIYQQIKKLEEKLKGAKEALEESLKELKKLNSIAEEEERKPKYLIVEPKYEWYHGFRWFKTSKSDLLVVAGKDAQTNETLLKKYLEENDLVLHTEAPGGAVIILKNGKTYAKKEDLEEAAIYAASYSQAWKEGITATDVFYTSKEHISLSPPPKTYLKKGAFMVHRKNLLRNIRLELAIGIKLLINNNFVSSIILATPLSAISTHADYYCIIRPGKLGKSQVAKIIYKHFIGTITAKLPNCDKRTASKIVKIEKITELIPGPSEVECPHEKTES